MQEGGQSTLAEYGFAVKFIGMMGECETTGKWVMDMLYAVWTGEVHCPKLQKKDFFTSAKKFTKTTEALVMSIKIIQKLLNDLSPLAIATESKMASDLNIMKKALVAGPALGTSFLPCMYI